MSKFKNQNRQKMKTQKENFNNLLNYRAELITLERESERSYGINGKDY